MLRERSERVEGLAARTTTEYRGDDLVRAGVRGVHGDLGMSARVRSFSTLVVIEATGTGSEFTRRPVAPGVATIDFIFVEHGVFEYLAGTEWRRSSGPLMIAPSGLPHRVRFVGPWKFIVARVPREALLNYTPLIADTVAIYEDLSIPERAMHAFLGQVVAGNEQVSEGHSHTVDRFVLDMAGTLLRERSGIAVGTGTPRAVLRDRALAEIGQRRSDPSLTPARVAFSVGASLRHLQSVFAESNSSVAGEIRRERARVARALLQDPRRDDLEVDDVARLSGFGSSASMRRVLLEMYGFGPRELRNGRGVAAQ